MKKITINEEQFDNLFVHKIEQLESDDYLLAHLCTEYFYRNDKLLIAEGYLPKKILIEKYGLFSFCEEMTKEIVDEIDIGNLDVELKGNYGDKSFIIKVNIISTSAVEYAACSFDESNIFKYIEYETMKIMYKYNPLTIRINFQNVNRNNIYPLIIHELLHAKQNIGLIEKGKTLNNELNKIGYEKCRKKYDNFIDKLIANLFYFFNSYEKGAFIAQIVGEFKQNNVLSDSVDGILEILKNTQTYQNYQYLNNIANEILNLEDTKENFEVLNNSISKVSDITFKNRNQLNKWISNKIRKITNKFGTTIPKIAYDNLRVCRILPPNTLESVKIVKNLDEIMKDAINNYINPSRKYLL